MSRMPVLVPMLGLAALWGLGGPACDGSRSRSNRVKRAGAMGSKTVALRAAMARRRVTTPPPRPRARARAGARPPLGEMPIRGFGPSSYVAPTGPQKGARPVLVLLHGSYDGRAAECRAWARVGARHGWLLCPAGRHRPDEPKDVDRWTWGKVAHLLIEVRRGLAALEKRYPGRVDHRRLTLVGFSLGALLAPEVAYFGWGLFPRLVLVEGVFRLRGKWSRRLHRRGVRRVAYVCGEKTHCQVQVPKRKQYLTRAGIAVRSFVIPGAGHGYGDRFDPVAEQILTWVLAEKRPSEFRIPRRK